MSAKKKAREERMQAKKEAIKAQNGELDETETPSPEPEKVEETTEVKEEAKKTIKKETKK